MTTIRDIQWPRAKYWDRAWNPVIGCRPCSPACDNCYARAWAGRFGQSFAPHESTRGRPPRKGVVFCGNMTDLFGEWVEYPGHYVAKAVDAAETADAILFLTKRADRMVAFLRNYGPVQDWQENGWLHNVYFGFTAENQEWYDRRHLDVIGRPKGMPKWAQWWVSCEPLLGPIHLWMPPFFRAPSWVVVGCESGPRRRPCRVEWVESVVEQCVSSGVPVFVKQLDIGGKCVTDINKFPEHLRIRQAPWRLRSRERLASALRDTLTVWSRIGLETAP